MPTTWTRHGECNHCGWCCEVLAREFVVRSPVDSYWVEFYKARGFKKVSAGDFVGRFAVLTAPCPEHINDRCALEERKPRRCKEFPVVPAEIIGSPCSYWFENGRMKAGGTGSPFPCDETGLVDIEMRMEAK